MIGAGSFFPVEILLNEVMEKNVVLILGQTKISFSVLFTIHLREMQNGCELLLQLRSHL